jgi:hypothetical protein
MDEEERAAMEFFIACASEDHPVIPGTGGFCKARWSRRGQSKSARKQTLSAADENVLAKLASAIKKETSVGL